MNKSESLQKVINVFKELPTFQRTTFRQLLKKTHYFNYTIDYDTKKISFKLESESRVLFERKYSFQPVIDNQKIDPATIKTTGSDVYTFDRTEILQIIDEIK